ncbi:telomere-protecting terminal protein Tpg [Streptomyces mutabilis]|uniref:telomere-protecting terminal protein Tpg n=1 Tax=Streptomyces mutabilis TaxID=67332 RepID=UPI003F4DD4D3
MSLTEVAKDTGLNRRRPASTWLPTDPPPFRAGRRTVVIHTRARFGFTTAPGTTDDARIRDLTLALPPHHAARPLEAQDTGADERQLRAQAPEALNEMYVRDGDRRATVTLVCHRPHLPADPHQALRTADYSVTADIEAAHRHYYGTPTAGPPPPDEPAAPASRWLTLPALDRLVSHDSPRPCAAPCTPPPIAWRHRPPPAPLTAPTAQRVAHRLHATTAHPHLAAAVAAALFTGASPPSNSPPHAPATTTLPRPRSSCTTAPATPTAAPPTPYHPGPTSSCGPQPASPGSSPARTKNCSPRQVTMRTCYAWRRRPDCVRPSHPQPPPKKARSAAWSGTGESGRKPKGTKRDWPAAAGPRDPDP